MKLKYYISYINPNGIRVRESDNWTAYDHVGASAKYSVPVLSSDCPTGHTIKFFAEYWLPENPNHIIKRGVVSIKVKGKDETPPELQWVKISGDNTIETKIYDGGKIKTVKARFRLKEDQGKFFEIEINDDGKDGDHSKADFVFSRKIQEREFGLHRVEIGAVDKYGNQIIKQWPEILVIH